MIRERGSAVVESALVLPVVLVVLLAGLEVVAVARTQLHLVAAAREGARVAATVADPARAVAAVRAALGPEEGSRVGVTVTRGGRGSSATVTVRLRHRLVTPLLRSLTVELRSRAVMRVER